MAKYTFGEIAINQMNNRRKLEEEQKQFNEKMAEEIRQANLLTAFRNQQIANEQQQLKLYAERDAETRRQNEWERAQDPVAQQNEGLIGNKWMNYSVTKSGKVIPTSGAPNPYAGLYAGGGGNGGYNGDPTNLEFIKAADAEITDILGEEGNFVQSRKGGKYELGKSGLSGFTEPIKGTDEEDTKMKRNMKQAELNKIRDADWTKIKAKKKVASDRIKATMPNNARAYYDRFYNQTKDLDISREEKAKLYWDTFGELRNRRLINDDDYYYAALLGRLDYNELDAPTRKISPDIKVKGGNPYDSQKVK